MDISVTFGRHRALALQWLTGLSFGYAIDGEAQTIIDQGVMVFFRSPS